jgi:hypothetical protein
LSFVSAKLVKAIVACVFSRFVALDIPYFF